MGLLDGKTHKDYYEGSDHGNYQFTSLDSIITQFEIAYVGEDKLIPKIKRADIAFHAQRALQELSFDTFKSIKSQQIELPPSLQMILPHDYVNYTKISWTDNSGIKHPLYPTKHTSNPFQIRQHGGSKKSYYFESGENMVENGDFSTIIFNQGNWVASSLGEQSKTWSSITTTAAGNQYPDYIYDEVTSPNENLQFKHYQKKGGSGVGSHSYGVYQKINTIGIRDITLRATGNSADQQTNSSAGDIAGYGVLRVGLTTTDPNTGLKADGSIGWARPDGTAIPASFSYPFSINNPSPNYHAENIDLGYMEWSDGSTYQQEIEDIDVSSYDTVWVYIQSYVPFTEASITDVDTYVNSAGKTVTTAGTNPSVTGGGPGCTPVSAATGNLFNNNTASSNFLDEVSLTTADTPNILMNANVGGNSDTWDNYKSTTPSENNNDDYQDDTYWPNQGERYGLEPSHAQVNGSFFIDDRRGLIHFSSNVSGKDVILDYISDSLGTDEEMKVHKFAEEAMYKFMLCNIMSARANIGKGQLMYYKRDKFAAIRNAKLRLSNIKLEEITQILRGKSKHIKH